MIPLALVLVVDIIVESDRVLVDPREGTVTVVRLIVELVEAFVFLLVVGVERGTVEAAMVVAVAVVDGGAPTQLRGSQKQIGLLLRLQSTHMRVSSVTSCSVQ